MTNMTTYNLRITRPRPSFCEDRVVFQAASYAAAVQVAHDAYRRALRPVCLGSGEWGMECWHRIADGVAIDKNTNSGVPARQEVK
jgi:hypothetical protein